MAKFEGRNSVFFAFISDRYRDFSSEVWYIRGRVFSTATGATFTAYHKGKTKLDKLISKGEGSSIAKDDDSSMPPWRLHDLRRTLATGFQRLGVRFEVTEAVLNHVGGSRSGVAGVYQRHDWKPEKRAALSTWNDHLSRAIETAQK